MEPCAEAAATPQGFVLDLSVASGGAFPGSEFSGGRWDLFAAWVTAGYAGRGHSVVGLLRFRDEGPTESGDAGVRGTWTRGRYGASLEAIYRGVPHRDGWEHLWRLAAIADLALTPDLWLTVTMGKDFEDAKGDTVLAVLGLRWTLGKRDDRLADATVQGALGDAP